MKLILNFMYFQNYNSMYKKYPQDINIDSIKIYSSQVKLSRYTPWGHMGGQEV
jgi:hypothetical protein